MTDLARLKAFLAEEDDLGLADPEAALDVVAAALGLLDEGVEHAGQLDDEARHSVAEARDRDGYSCPECGRFTYAPEADDSRPPDCEGCGAPTLPCWETAAQSSRDGERYFARYRLVEELGRGGMGVVYEAFDPDLRRRVAIKALKELDASPSWVERLQREAQMVAGLTHADIVTVHEVGLADRDGGGPPIPYLVMELAEKRTFRELLGARPRRERVALLARVAHAIGHAHAHGIVHRDLKPENILVRADGQPIVSDFGLARRATDERATLTRDGAVMGTLPYMAPEQVLGEREAVGPATDVWALGVMLFEQLTGRQPFLGTISELFAAIPGDEPPRPRALDASIPRDIQTVALKALDKNPRRRYADGAELAADLERWLAGESVRARPVGQLTRLYRRVRRNPWRLAAGLALGLLIVGAFGWRAREHAREQRQAADKAIRVEVESARRLLSEWGNQRYLLPHPLGPERLRLQRSRDRLIEVARREAGADAAHAELGRLRFHLGELAAAHADLQRALALAPDNGRYHFLLGRVLVAGYERERLGLERVDPVKFPDTRKAMEAALARRREPIRAAFAKAMKLLGPDASPAWMHDYADATVCWIEANIERAIGKCRHVAKQHPVGGEEGLLLLAQMTDDPAKAVALYDEAIDRARSFPEAYRRAAIARVMLAAHRARAKAPPADEIVELHRRAVAQATQAIAIDEASLAAHLALGEVHLSWGRWLAGGEMPDVDAAEEQLTRAITAYGNAADLAPDDPEAWRRRGEAASELGRALGSMRRTRAMARYDDAERWLGRAISLDGDAARSWVARARMYLAKAKIDPAEIYCRRASQDVERALRLEPMLEAVYRPLLEQCFADVR